MSTREIISDCLNGVVKRSALKKLISKCHTMALAYLRMKASSNQLYMIRGERLEDLAWDFIADLFERNSDDEYVKLNEYFSDLNHKELNEEDIEIELRKLVFTKVDDNVFRAVGEKDPSLRKIIRNLKLAVKSTDSNHWVYYEDSSLIVEQEEWQQLPTMPSEFMQIKLCARLEEGMQIPEIVKEAIDILQNQDRYRKRFSLIALATIIRETFVHFHEPSSKNKSKPKADNYLLNGEFEEFLQRSANSVQITTGSKYIEKGKITQKELALYTDAAIDIVRDHFLEDKREYSQYEYLKDYMPDLKYSEFRENNRQILEYMVKLIRKDIVNIFKEDWQ